MSLRPISIVEGIAKLSEIAEAREISRCNWEIRKQFQRERIKQVQRICVKQFPSEEDKFELTIHNTLLPWKNAQLNLNLNELKDKLQSFSAVSVKFEVSGQATAELLEFLSAKWFDNSTFIEIDCQHGTRPQDPTISNKLKKKITEILARFRIIDNILFESDEIETSRYEICRMICCREKTEQFQKKSLRIRYEYLGITAEDINRIAQSSRLSKHFHFRYSANRDRLQWSKRLIQEMKNDADKLMLYKDREVFHMRNLNLQQFLNFMKNEAALLSVVLPILAGRYYFDNLPFMQIFWFGAFAMSCFLLLFLVFFISDCFYAHTDELDRELLDD